jgi:predicted XRE-type DNA-binding protein
MTKPMKTEKLLVTRSSANIFADLGFDTAEATNLLMRANLMSGVQIWFESSGLTQAKAAKQLGINQPRLNMLLKGKINEFSLDSLVNIASAAGLRLKLSSSQPKPTLKRAA